MDDQQAPPVGGLVDRFVVQFDTGEAQLRRRAAALRRGCRRYRGRVCPVSTCCSAPDYVPISCCRTARTFPMARALLHQVIGLQHSFNIAGGLIACFDVINPFDEKYGIRNGTGVGVGAPGPRRGFFGGIEKTF
jgi:hypothetical protein